MGTDNYDQYGLGHVLVLIRKGSRGARGVRGGSGLGDPGTFFGYCFVI